MAKIEQLIIRGVTESQKNELRQIGLERYGKASASHVVKESIRQLLADGGAAEVHAYDLVDSGGEVSKSRIELRLLPGERAALERIAEACSSSPNYYVTSLLRAHLTVLPQLQGGEIELLRQSNLQLMGVARNVNQIARRLNQEGAGDVDMKLFDSIVEIIRGHVKIVTDVLDANIQRWDVKNE